MIAVDLIVIMLIVIGSAIATVLVTVAVSSMVQKRRVRREPLLAEARRSVAVALSGGPSEEDEAVATLSRLPKRSMTSVLLDLAPSVTGTSRAVLVSLGTRLGVLEQAHRRVHSRRWSTRLYSARVLSAFGVVSEDLFDLFTDPAPEVRAQAAAWTVVTPDHLAVELLIGLLDDPDGLCRFAAKDALIRIGLPGSDALVHALEIATPEDTDPLLEIAAAMGDERFQELATVLTMDPSPRTRALAVAVLARIGDPTAGPMLVALLSDPSNEVVVAAAAGLGQLSYWPGAAEVEPLLSRPSWDVRKQAGLTLSELGPPGNVLLWANAPGDGPKAEMAIQTLQLRSLSAHQESS
jgi:HEAT repeat protein